MLSIFPKFFSGCSLLKSTTVIFFKTSFRPLRIVSDVVLSAAFTRQVRNFLHTSLHSAKLRSQRTRGYARTGIASPGASSPHWSESSNSLISKASINSVVDLSLVPFPLSTVIPHRCTLERSVMKIRNFIAVSFLTALVLLGNRAFAQANVVENESLQVYVDAIHGSNSYPGTQSEPLKTIGAAVIKAELNNRNGAGTRVLINPGVYRELVSITPTYRQTSAPITFQAVQTGTAIIAGSDQLSNWSYSGNGIYSTGWADTVQACGTPSGWPGGIQPITLHREMLFVNGASMTQVLDWNELRPGTFYLNPVYRVVHVLPPAGTNMSTALVEIASRPQTLTLWGRSNIVFRGLVFRHAASCINTDGALVGGSSNILFDNVQALWNNWGGLGIDSSTNVTVQNSVGSYNGGVGISLFESQNTLLQNDETDYNNWRGAQGNFYNWGMGGVKFFRSRNAQVVGLYSYNNHAQGLWFDTDNKNATVTDVTLSGNLVDNLQIEKNQGPITIQGSNLSSGDVGLELINTSNLTVTGTTFINNGNGPSQQAQFYLAGAPGGESFNDWQTGQYYNVNSTNTKLSENTFIDGGSGQYVFGTYVSGTTWSEFTGSLSSSQNSWYDSTKQTAFQTPDGRQETFSGWQSLTGQDYSSSWSLPTSPSGLAVTPLLAPAPAVADFNVYRATLRNEYLTNYMSNGTVSIPLQVKSFGYGPVSLSVTALPRGVWGYFSSSTLTSGSTILTLRAAPSASTQTIPITVLATGNGRVHTLTMEVYVRP